MVDKKWCAAMYLIDAMEKKLRFSNGIIFVDCLDTFVLLMDGKAIEVRRFVSVECVECAIVVRNRRRPIGGWMAAELCILMCALRSIFVFNAQSRNQVHSAI